MKDFGLISVIIPTYNRESTIVRSAMSVLNQTYKNIELIIIDDCSTDKTEVIVSAIADPRIRYFRQDTNHGACVARNRGIDEARGDYIAFQDSDDEWLPNKLEVQLNKLEESGADVCFCRMERHMDEETIRIFPKARGNRIMERSELCNHSYVSTQMLLAKKAVFDEHRFDPLVKRTQDYEWTIRASRNHKFYYAEDILVIQYLQNDSLTYSGHKKSIEAREYFLKKYKEEFANDPEFETFQLRVIARNKALLGENPSAEYKRLLQLNRKFTYFVCLCLSKARLIRIAYSLIGYRKFEN